MKFFTGSCWNDAVAMSAACKSLEISHSNKVADNVMSKVVILRQQSMKRLSNTNFL